MDPPFYVLFSEDESTGGSTPDTSVLGSSHDTSRAKYHIQDVAAFAEDLNQAAKNAFPNRGRSRYNSVNVSLIRWEEDELNVRPELERLDNKFQDYGFRTTQWLIPSQNASLELTRKSINFIDAEDNDHNLFILYYAGHGRIDSERQAEWTCNRYPNSARLNWSSVQRLFANAKSDVLILLDTCAAASSTVRSEQGSMEAILACGFESRAAPPGEHSFTNMLIEVLEDWINRKSFSASCLHAEILSQLKLKETRKGREGTKLEWCSTPIHINYSRDPKAPGIELCRRNVLPAPIVASEESSSIDAMDLDFDDTTTASSPLSSLTSSGEFQTPHVLIKIGLEHNQGPLDVRQCLRWLGGIPLLSKWAKIEGVYPSYSTLMILSVPIAVWNMLPDHPACSFIGYSTAPNILPVCWACCNESCGREVSRYLYGNNCPDCGHKYCDSCESLSIAELETPHDKQEDKTKAPSTHEVIERACQNFLELLYPKTLSTIEMLANLGAETRLSTERANHSSTRLELTNEKKAHQDSRYELESQLQAVQKQLREEKTQRQATEAVRVMLVEKLQQQEEARRKSEAAKASLEGKLQQKEEALSKMEEARATLNRRLQEEDNKYKEAEEETVRLKKELEEANKVKGQMDDELKNKKTSQQATRNADAKAVTDTMNSLLKGDGRFNDGYPQESENGKTELDEKYLLTTDGTVKRKPQNTHSDQPKPKDRKLGRFLGGN